MFVDASDIDNDYSIAPTGTDRTNVLSAMAVRGQTVLNLQKEMSYLKTEPVRNSTNYMYREHYAVGDIITVDSEYSETSSMRISEYVEIEDETGEIGYPTFSAV